MLVPDPDDLNDIRHTDMKGADFVVISKQGEILLVDSKGRSRIHEATVRERNTAAGLPEYIFKNIQAQRKDLEGVHPRVDVVLGRRFVHSIPMMGIVIETSSDPKELGVGKFRGRAGNVYMSDINRQLDNIREYETAA